MKKIIFVAIVASVLFAQNSNPNCLITNKTFQKKCILTLHSVGTGTAGINNYTSAQAKLMARRAAILDAYKQLAEQLYGIKIEGKDTLKNMVLRNSTIRAYVQGLIRGASIEEEEYKNGIYSVSMSLKINPNEWNKFLLNK